MEVRDFFPPPDSGVFARHDPGVPAGHGTLLKGSLLDFFNMVSGMGQAGSVQGHGGIDYGRGRNGPGFRKASSSGSIR